MRKTTIQIESLDAKSRCVTRNGTYQISEVIVEESGDGMAKISFVSKRLNRSLNAGATISVSDMDRLATQWLQARGGKPNARIRRLIDDLCNTTDAIRKEL
jgi:hypothetical protein